MVSRMVDKTADTLVCCLVAMRVCTMAVRMAGKRVVKMDMILVAWMVA